MDIGSTITAIMALRTQGSNLLNIAETAQPHPPCRCERREATSSTNAETAAPHPPCRRERSEATFSTNAEAAAPQEEHFRSPAARQTIRY